MVKALEDIIAKSSSIVFFGGAGVSTESGIPDFRSVDGLYHQKYDYPPETILSHTFWEENPEEFYRFYRDKLIVKGAKPNAAHLRLAKLEQQGKLRALRPLESLAPCFLLRTGCVPARTAPVWVPLEDRVQLALLLAKGYAALDSRPYGGSLALALYPLKETE